MKSPFEDVGAFHRKFGLPVARTDREAALLSEPLFMYRSRFLEEELDELRTAHEEGNLTKFADALADLVWVAYGTAHFAGIDLDLVWQHVRTANMQKILAPPDSGMHKRDAAGYAETIRKPNGWVSPEAGIEASLRSWNEIAWNHRNGRTP